MLCTSGTAVYVITMFPSTQVFSAQGPGLSFVAFSEAILSMPVSPLYMGSSLLCDAGPFGTRKPVWQLGGHHHCSV